MMPARSGMAIEPTQNQLRGSKSRPMLRAKSKIALDRPTPVLPGSSDIGDDSLAHFLPVERDGTTSSLPNDRHGRMPPGNPFGTGHGGSHAQSRSYAHQDPEDSDSDDGELADLGQVIKYWKIEAVEEDHDASDVMVGEHAQTREAGQSSEIAAIHYKPSSRSTMDTVTNTSATHAQIDAVPRLTERELEQTHIRLRDLGEFQVASVELLFRTSWFLRDEMAGSYREAWQ